MNITKIKLDEMYRAYSASYMHMEDGLHLLVASEEKGYPCYDYYGKDFKKRNVVWRDGGGCMSLIQIPGRKNEFLAVQQFYLKVTPSLSKIVWGKYENEDWHVQDVINIPYIHRFDIFDVDGKLYFIGATIAESKKDKEDWSIPGKIYVASIPEDLNNGLELKEIAGGLFRNHGYTRDYEDGYPVGYFTSDQGILKVTPPKDGSDWQCEKIMDGKVGEVAVLDIDGDGAKEIMTIEEFHGNQIHIYKQINGEYKRVYTYKNEIDFAHTLVATTFRGVPTFLAGVRRVDAEIFYVQYLNGEFVTKIIDTNVGPANLNVVNESGIDYIIAANHTANEVAVYEVTEKSNV